MDTRMDISHALRSWIVGATVVAALVLNALFTYMVVELQDRLIIQEGDLMELAQVILACAATLVYFLAARRLGHVLTPYGLALLSLSFMLREADIDNLGAPALSIFFVQGTGRNVILLALWLWLSYRGFRAFRATTSDLLRHMATLSGRLLPVVLVFLLLGAIFDHGLIKGRFQLFAEELAEFNAYYILFVAALLFRPNPSPNADQV